MKVTFRFKRSQENIFSISHPHQTGRNRLFLLHSIALSVLIVATLFFVIPKTAHADGLPGPWADSDIGNVGIAGSASYSNGAISDTGSSIIEYTYDKFHFVYQPLYGDGTIVARISGLTGGANNAKAGIMIRDNLSGYPAAINAFAQLNASGAITFQRRLSTGGDTSYSTLAGTFSKPYWVKLVRSGNTFTASASPNGQAWTQIGSDTISNMTVDAWAGLAVASGSDSATSTATFDNISITQPAINTSVDWTNTRGNISNLAYGTNGYSALDPAVLSDGNYSTAIAATNAGHIRLHYAGLLSDSASDSRGWVSNANKTWDAAHIKTILDGISSWSSKGYTPQVVINIPGFPGWLPTYSITDGNNSNAVVTDNLLATNQFDAYASFCAQLVKIVNVDQGRGIKYFELPNESDNNYNQRIVDYNKANGTNFPIKMDELATLYNKAVVAMKKVDPTILVGGPAFQRPDTIAGVTTFINNTANQSNPTTLDFLSMHAYASGSASDSDFYIYNRVYNPASNVGSEEDNMVAVRQALDNASAGKHIPLWADEYNISWTYQTHDARMTNYKGVVYDALFLTYYLSNGADTTSSWNDADGIYGKIDPYSSPTYQLRPGGQFLQLMNRYGIGSRVAVTTSVENTIVPFAVKTATGYSYILTNRSPNARQVNTSFNGGPATSGSFSENQFSAAGLTTGTLNNIGTLTVPAFSVTILTTGSGTGTGNSLFSTGFEGGDTQPTWTDTIDAGGYPAGGSSNVGGICCGLTGPEFGPRNEGGHAGSSALMYSGKDNSSSTSYAYGKIFDLNSQHITVSSGTTLSYWIYPQSQNNNGLASGSNSSCVAIDIIFTDGTNLRDSGAVDQNGNRVHPAYQCNKLTLDSWNHVVSVIGANVSGKTISRIDVGYDQPANTGSYRGYIDDISIHN